MKMIKGFLVVFALVISHFAMAQCITNVNAGKDTAVCKGSGTLLRATDATTYTWSPSAGLSSTTGAQVTATPIRTTTYTVTAVDVNGCTSTDEVTVTVNPLPVLSVSSNVTICQGTTTQLQASGAVSIFWFPSAGLSNSDIANPLASPSQTTIYTAVATDENGCSNNDVKRVTVTVLQAPLVNAGSDMSICQYDQTNLSASGGNAFTWSPATGLSNPNIANPVASPANTTVYTVTGFSLNGCTSTDQVIVTVNTPTLNVGANQIVCEGSPVQLNASGAVSYSWSPASGLSDAYIGNPLATVSSTTSYTVKAEDANGCSSMGRVSITVIPKPAITVTGATTVCSGAAVALQASGANSYSWSPSGSFSNPTISNPVIIALSTTTYTVTGTAANGCTASVPVTVNVNSKPMVNAGADKTICAGDPVQLNATGATTFTWTPSAGLSNTAIANPVANPSSTITYTVTGTDATGCTNSDQIVVTVKPKPLVDAGPDISICSGSSIALGATGATTFSWSPVTGLSNPNAAITTASPAVTTTYTVTTTDDNGCTNTDEMTLTMRTVPVNAGADIVICAGQTAQLNATGADDYFWTPADETISDSEIFNPYVSPVTTTVYTVRGESENCAAYDQVKVSVLDLPVVSAGADQTICAGNSVTLQATGANRYSWSPASGLSAVNISNPVASPATTTTYIVTGTVNNGCVNTAQVTVTVNPKPIVDAGADKTICSGSTGVTLVTTSTGATRYEWTPANGLSSATAASPLANPATTTTYTVKAMNEGGCFATDQVMVTVLSNPVVNAGADITICSGNTVQLQATNGVSYSWFPTTGLSNANSPNPTFTASGNITYTVTSKNGACVTTDDVVINVIAKPIIDAGADKEICTGTGTTLQTTSSGATRYSWLPRTGLSDATNPAPFANPTSNTLYTVTAFNAAGCSSSDQIQINVTSVKPNVNAGVDQTTCNGAPVNLNATGAASYKWNVSSTLSSLTIPNPVASPTTTTTYVVTGTAANGCTNTDKVIVNVKPKPNVNAGADVTVCAGQTVTLRASGATNYLWSGVPSSGANRAVVNVTPTVTTTYTVTTSGANGCNGSDEVTVNVNQLPPVNAGPDLNICGHSETVQLNATGAVSYRWSPSSIVSNPNIPNPTVNWSDLRTSTYTEFTVTGTSAEGCIATDKVNVRITYTPQVLAGFDQTICLGTPAFMGTSKGLFPWEPNEYSNFTFQWSPSAGLSNPTDQGTNVTPLVTTTYTLTITSKTSGCTKSDDVTIFVETVPPVLTVGADQTICEGRSIQLEASGANYYEWTPVGRDGFVKERRPTVYPLTTTTYTVTGRNFPKGCPSVKSVTITVNPKPVVSAGLDKSLCSGTPVTLDGSGVGIVRYHWTPESRVSDANIANPVVNTSSVFTTFTLIGTDANGCTNTDQVDVRANPVVDAGPGVAVCPGTPVSLQATSASDMVSYKWTPEYGLDNPNVANPNVTNLNSNMLYTVTAKDASGCVATDQVRITLLTEPSVNAGPDKSFCSNGSTTLMATVRGGNTVRWSPSDGLTSTINAITVAKPAAERTVYTITATSIGGCIATDEVIVYRGEMPVVNAGVDQTFCTNIATTLTATTATPGGTMVWTDGSGAVLASNTLTTTFTPPSLSTECNFRQTFNYNYPGLNFSCSAADNVRINILQPPVLKNNGRNFYVDLTTLPPGVTAKDFNWQYSITLSNTGPVNPWDYNGCRGSATCYMQADYWRYWRVSMVYDLGTSYGGGTCIKNTPWMYPPGQPSAKISDDTDQQVTLSSLGTLVVYPVPTQNTITLELNSTHTISEISIYNMLNKEVLHVSADGNKTEVEVSSLPSGIYLLRLKDSNGEYHTERIEVKK